MGVKWCPQGAGATATSQILAFCRYFCLGEGVWPWQSRACEQRITGQWAAGEVGLNAQGVQRRWHQCFPPATGTVPATHLWEREMFQPGEGTATAPWGINHALLEASASRVGGVPCLRYSAPKSCVQTQRGLLPVHSSQEPFSFVFKSQGRIICRTTGSGI